MVASIVLSLPKSTVLLVRLLPESKANASCSFPPNPGLHRRCPVLRQPPVGVVVVNAGTRFNDSERVFDTYKSRARWTHLQTVRPFEPPTEPAPILRAS